MPEKGPRDSQGEQRLEHAATLLGLFIELDKITLQLQQILESAEDTPDDRLIDRWEFICRQYQRSVDVLNAVIRRRNANHIRNKEICDL